MPAVWVIDPYRAGERNQVLALADALGWPCEVKRLRYRKCAPLAGILRGSGLLGIRVARSDPLRPPWPDLLLSSGVRNEPVCRWIRGQSGGRARIVHVGNPWADPGRFDCVITTPQYRVPERGNVLRNSLTLNRVSGERLERAAARWRSAVAHLPRPYTAVIVGGDSGPFSFGPRAARRLAADVNCLLRESGGAALVSTSSRTSERARRALESSLRVPRSFHRWRADGAANPYFGWLALAERIVVTADSIAMLSEACATGKPVLMFDLGRGAWAMRPGAPGGWRDNDWRLGGVMYRLLMRYGWRRLSRDIGLAQRRLLDSGRACWLDCPRALEPVPGGDMEAALRAVRALFR